MRHPAHLMDFDTLLCGLNAAIADGQAGLHGPAVVPPPSCPVKVNF